MMMMSMQLTVVGCGETVDTTEFSQWIERRTFLTMVWKEGTRESIVELG